MVFAALQASLASESESVSVPRGDMDVHELLRFGGEQTHAMYKEVLRSVPSKPAKLSNLPLDALTRATLSERDVVKVFFFFEPDAVTVFASASTTQSRWLLLLGMPCPFASQAPIHLSG